MSCSVLKGINMKKILFAFLFLSAGCTTIHNVTPVKSAPSMGSEKNICVINNPTTSEYFRHVMVDALEKKGFQVLIVESNHNANCPVYINYVGKWTWSFNKYLSYASIKVFDSGQEIGRAYYNAIGSNSSPISRFKNPDTKIRELIDELF